MNLEEPVWLVEGPGAAIALHREVIEFEARRGLGFDDWATGQSCWFWFDAGDWDELLQAATAVLAFEGQTGERRQSGAMALTMRSRVLLHRGQVEQASEAVPEISRVSGGTTGKS